MFCCKVEAAGTPVLPGGGGVTAQGTPSSPLWNPPHTVRLRPEQPEKANGLGSSCVLGSLAVRQLSSMT